MTKIDDIPVIVASPDNDEHGNALPVLNEIRHALERLIQQGEPTQIDLNAIPFGPGDEQRLLDFLGEGEVTATVSAMGPTLIHESRFTGVWTVDYRNRDDERLALHVEVAPIPRILRTQDQDLEDALKDLETELRLTQSPPEPGEET